MKLYLMRHGQTQFNVQGRVQGWCDSPLTDEGIKQSERAGLYFQDKGIIFDALYSSTQERATDTAKLVVPNQTVTQLKGLKEMNFGDFEAQPEYLLPKFKPGTRSFEDLLLPYGGESIADVGQRVFDTVTRVAHQAEQLGQDRLLMVSHGAALWGLIVKLDQPFPEGVRFGNCAICVYDYKEGSLVLDQVIDPLTGLEVEL